MAKLVTVVMKANRAKEHLNSLEEAIRKFYSPPAGKPNPQRMRFYDDLPAGEYVLELSIDEPPLDWGIFAGEYIGSLRSSLDWLAWQLATLTTDFPSDRVSFPIWGKYSARAESEIAKCTNGIPEKAVAIMKEIQPYNYGPSFKETHLWRLQCLWNVEKHRHLLINTIGLEVEVIPPKGTPYRLTDVVDNRAQVRFPLSAKGKVKFNPRGSRPILTFGDDEEGIHLKITDLREMHQFVSDKLIPRFNRFLL